MINEVSRAVKWHDVIGSLDEVTAAMLLAREQGRIVTLGKATRLPDNRVHVRVELAEPVKSQFHKIYAPGKTSIPTIRRDPLIIAGYILILGLLVSIPVGLALSLISWFVTLSWEWAPAAIFIVLVLSLLTAGAAVKSGHCPGCRG